MAALTRRLNLSASLKVVARILRKRGQRSTDDGVPLCSFHHLMAHLATQTMNVVAVPGAPEAAFTTISKATALQEAAFKPSTPNRGVSSKPTPKIEKGPGNTAKLLHS